MRVIIVGAGIWGLAVADACLRKGDDVCIYDAGQIGNGASGGIVGALAPHVPDQWNPKKQFQFEALESAAGFWAETDALSGQSSGYGRIGRLQPLLSEKAVTLAAKRTTSAQDLWQGRYSWDIIDRPTTLSEQSAPFGVVHDSLSARINPARATASLAAACIKRGAQIYENRPVTNLSDYGVAGPWGQDTADAVVVSAGVQGFDLITPYTEEPAGSGVKGQAALLNLDLSNHPQIYADGIYIIPHADGTVAVGSTSENAWSHADTDDQLNTVLDKARAICPDLQHAEVIKRWAGIRPKARRRDPMLGAVPNLMGVYTALGAFKIGFGLSHKIGSVVAAQIHNQPVDIPESFTLDWHMA